MRTPPRARPPGRPAAPPPGARPPSRPGPRGPSGSPTEPPPAAAGLRVEPREDPGPRKSFLSGEARPERLPAPPPPRRRGALAARLPSPGPFPPSFLPVPRGKLVRFSGMRLPNSESRAGSNSARNPCSSGRPGRLPGMRLCLPVLKPLARQRPGVTCAEGDLSVP